MLLRSSLSGKSSSSCSDCVGEASALEPTTSGSGNSPFFSFLMKGAENGWLPDRLIRIGIRQLLKKRLEHLEERSNETTVEDFIKSTLSSPIAVSPQKANEQHYEVPAAFFKIVLGEQLKYSCCYWEPETKTLDEAETVALSRTCEIAQLKDGNSILELGCGWGSLSLWMAEHYPNSKITSVSNSHSQRKFIEEQIAQKGLHNLTVVTEDINTFRSEQQYDRVVSVEMFEHMRNHHQLLENIYEWLSPGGLLYTHIFCHKTTPYLFQTDGAANWMGRHFFSGGMMPSLDMLPKCESRLNHLSHEVWNGEHYAKTCRAWLNKQDKYKTDIMPLMEKTYGAHQAHIWFHRWRLFFLACEELFAFDKGAEWFVAHYLFERT